MRPPGKPYTVNGIRRVPCSRCGKPSYASWQVCAIGRRHAAMCAACDVAVNEMVLKFMRWPGRGRVMKAYKRKVGINVERKNRAG